MNVLAINAGSNSLRYKLVSLEGAERVLEEGLVDRVQGAGVIEAVDKAIEACRPHTINVAGVRVVHGGGRYSVPTRVTPGVIRELESITALAPLHLPTDIAILKEIPTKIPDIPVIAVFDTAFHQTIPAVASHYALPKEIGSRRSRFGFHGLAHEYVISELSKLPHRHSRAGRVISLHLGGGASACAVRDGKSVDTSMGMTPLEGLMMSTRCGDIDPGIILELFREGRAVDEIEDLLYRKSGLLGLSGKSGDIRELEPLAASGNRRAELALESYGYRVRKYVGAYVAVLGGLDAIVLSGALAEHSPTFRVRILHGLECFGVLVSPDRNRNAGEERTFRISPITSSVETWIIPADEERQIARAVYEWGTVGRGARAKFT